MVAFLEFLHKECEIKAWFGSSFFVYWYSDIDVQHWKRWTKDQSGRSSTITTNISLCRESLGS